MNWLVFDPYLSSMGGGERYAFAIADWARRNGRDVTLAGPCPPLPSLVARLGLPADLTMRPMTKLGFMPMSVRYDTTVMVANEPPPPSFARQSIIVVQFPFGALSANPIRRAIERRALSRAHCVVYSEYARKWLANRWNVDSAVVSPPVELGKFDPAAKERLILAVGRFFPGYHSKRQDLLLDAWALLPDAVRREWQLVLAGGVASDTASVRYLADIQQRAKALGVRVLVDVSADDLRSLYRRASLFWHATGAGRSVDQPEKAEHFGMTTVEAMSYGAVPLVFGDGGQTEIVNASCGVLWDSLAVLVQATEELVVNTHKRAKLARVAVWRAGRYGPDAFAGALSRAVS